MSEIFCCNAIKNSFGERKGRTLFTFAEPPFLEIENQPSFWIGMRSVEYGDLEKINFTTDYPITISTRIPIFFCPWCGTELQKFYNNKYNCLVDQTLSEEFELT